MLKQTTSTELTPPISQSSPTRFHLGHREARIEDCLDRCCAPLVGVIPYEARQERRAELRTELAELIAAHMELDDDPELAFEGALRQLERMHITNQLRRRETWRRTEMRQSSARPATLAALVFFGLPFIADVTKFSWSVWERTFHVVTQNVVTDQLDSAAESAFYRFELFVVPIIAGLLTGLIARHRAGRGVLNAIALLTIPAILIPGFVMGLSYTGLGAGLADWLGRIVPSPLPGIVGITYWTALGIGGAHMGSRIRRSIDTWLLKDRARDSSVRLDPPGSLCVALVQ